MNGAEQKERAKAYEKIQKQIDELSIEIHNAWEVEVESRQESTRLLGMELAKEVNRVESLFASMLDAETQFRKKAIQENTTYLGNIIEARSEVLQKTIYAFLTLPWWKRWGWALFGFTFLKWSYKPSQTELEDAAKYAALQMEKARRQAEGKAVATISEENLRKAQSYTERPQ